MLNDSSMISFDRGIGQKLKLNTMQGSPFNAPLSGRGAGESSHLKIH